jgi:hypothetical protein
MGTREYSEGTGKYATSEGQGIGEQSTSERPSTETETAEQSRNWLKALPPWWERAGYASLADALAHEVAMQDRVMGRKPRDLRGLSLEEVVFREDPPSTRIRDLRPRQHQVNIKLTEDEHTRLMDAARSYGLRPATLARAFVVRATELARERDRETD